MKQTSNTSQKRQPNQKKASRPGKKSLRGIPENDYGELKKVRCLSLTPTCYAILQDLGRKLGCSVSEVVERFARLAHHFLFFLQFLEKFENQSIEKSSSYIEAESPNFIQLELFEPLE